MQNKGGGCAKRKPGGYNEFQCRERSSAYPCGKRSEHLRSADKSAEVPRDICNCHNGGRNKPATEQMVLQESAKGEAEGAKLQKRMEAEARGVAALMQARADGIKAVVEAAHGDAQAAVMLLMTDSLPDILKEYAKITAERPIDKLVCINSCGSNGQGRNDAVSNLTEAMIHAMPKIQEVIGVLSVVPGIHKESEETKTKSVWNR